MTRSALDQFIVDAADAIFGPWTLALFFGTGLFLTFRYRFVQVTRLREAVAAAFRRKVSGTGGALTPFQSFTTALSASIGTGNIAGVATAIVSGGPGALFWIWAYGFVATTIKLTEATLGAKYRKGDAKSLACGPMHYLADGLGLPRVGWLYAFLAGWAALLTTPLAQSNSIAVVLESEFRVDPWVTGVALSVLAAVVVLGGVKSIGRAAEKLAPLKILLYLTGGLFVLASFASELPGAFATIFREAFSLRSVGGGALGVAMLEAMRYGVARGIYANEAGYGSAAIAYGAAQSDRPIEQGLASIVEVYIVSFVTSSISGLVVIASGAVAAGKDSTAAVAHGFDAAMPGFGGALVAVCALLFGYTTLIGWAFYGEQILMHILGRRIAIPYRLVYCALIVVGAVAKVETVWAWGDLANTLMIFPNLVGVIGLSGLVARELRKHEELRGGRGVQEEDAAGRG